MSSKADEGMSPGLQRVLEEIERARLRALVDADMATADALHADDYELITPGAATLSKAEYLGGIADGSLNYQRFEPVGDVRVRLLGSTAAAVRYQVAIEIAWEGGEDGGRFWHTDVYELRDGQWLAVWSQETRIRSA
jgi:hypothetical protein